VAVVETDRVAFFTADEAAGEAGLWGVVSACVATETSDGWGVEGFSSSGRMKSGKSSALAAGCGA